MRILVYALPGGGLIACELPALRKPALDAWNPRSLR
jgi:hypothetical protein